MLSCQEEVRMLLKIFSIYDEKACVYNTPQYLAHKGEAIRMLQTTVDNKDSMLNKYPEDYSLYCLGTFDDNKGAFRGYSNPELVVRASELIADKVQKDSNEVQVEPV